MVARWYRALWSRFGGKPWTYIVRAEFSNPLYWLGVGLAIGTLAQPSWKWVLGLSLGVLFGHFWWGGKRTR